MKSGVELIAEERARQINVKGWTPEHDDGHRDASLAVAAAALAVMGTDATVCDPLERGSRDHMGHGDVWGLQRKHASDRKSQLVIAGALIAAEIDRLQRSVQPKKIAGMEP